MTMLMELLRKMGLLPRESVYYIGGSDILPAPLKGQEEAEVLTALEAGEEGAKQTLIEHNLRLVVFIARRFENTGTNLEDLISIGTIGLIKGVNTYRRDKNIKLDAFCRILVAFCRIFAAFFIELLTIPQLCDTMKEIKLLRWVSCTRNINGKTTNIIILIM